MSNTFRSPSDGMAYEVGTVSGFLVVFHDGKLPAGMRFANYAEYETWENTQTKSGQRRRATFYTLIKGAASAIESRQEGIAFGHIDIGTTMHRVPDCQQCHANLGYWHEGNPLPPKIKAFCLYCNHQII